MIQDDSRQGLLPRAAFLISSDQLAWYVFVSLPRTTETDLPPTSAYRGMSYIVKRQCETKQEPYTLKLKLTAVSPSHWSWNWEMYAIFVKIVASWVVKEVAVIVGLLQLAKKENNIWRLSRRMKSISTVNANCIIIYQMPRRQIETSRGIAEIYWPLWNSGKCW